jgi:hypothetical protein
MILPRAWVPKPSLFDYGHMSINRSIAASKPDAMRHEGGLFFKQTNETRRKNSYKGQATRMAMKFAKGLL